MEIQIEAKVDALVDVAVHIEDVMAALNKMPIKTRWSCVSIIIKGAEADLAGLTDEQKNIIRKFLEEKLALFNH